MHLVWARKASDRFPRARALEATTGDKAHTGLCHAGLGVKGDAGQIQVAQQTCPAAGFVQVVNPESGTQKPCLLYDSRRVASL